jgi:DNA-binding NarL/FixJ family response regulator
MRVRVAIIDDDDIQLRGMSEYLADRPEIEVVGMLNHHEAMLWDAQWDDVDIALVDAADPTQVADQFPGVEVADRIRRRRSSQQTKVIVVTGHFFDDAVRRRMREAGADYFYHRPELHKKDALYEAVLNPEAARAGVPADRDPDSAIRLGVGRSSRVNEAVRLTRSEGQPAHARRSRAWNTYRRTFNQVAVLQPMNSDGTPPDREQAEPSVTQIERFVKWATRIKGVDDA